MLTVTINRQTGSIAKPAVSGRECSWAPGFPHVGSIIGPMLVAHAFPCAGARRSWPAEQGGGSGPPARQPRAAAACTRRPGEMGPRHVCPGRRPQGCRFQGAIATRHQAVSARWSCVEMVWTAGGSGRRVAGPHGAALLFLEFVFLSCGNGTSTRDVADALLGRHPSVAPQEEGGGVAGASHLPLLPFPRARAQERLVVDRWGRFPLVQSPVSAQCRFISNLHFDVTEDDIKVSGGQGGLVPVSCRPCSQRGSDRCGYLSVF